MARSAASVVVVVVLGAVLLCAVCCALLHSTMASSGSGRWGCRSDRAPLVAVRPPSCMRVGAPLVLVSMWGGCWTAARLLRSLIRGARTHTAWCACRTRRVCRAPCAHTYEPTYVLGARGEQGRGRMIGSRVHLAAPLQVDRVCVCA
jgi:hypothetical protein